MEPRGTSQYRPPWGKGDRLSLVKRMSDPTPYPDVNQLLNELLRDAQTLLGKHFVGMYLYGSLALGDFDPGASDIDFVVATEDVLSAAYIAALQALHDRIAASHPRWSTELEGSYIPKLDLRRYNPARARHPHIFAGQLEIEQHGIHWVIERHVLREHGVVLAGPGPHTLIDPVHPNELRRAVVELVRSWWLPMVDHPVRLSDTKYQRYAVVTMCRVLYTLQHGTVASKPVATSWARDVLNTRWRSLIDRSRAGSTEGDGDAVDETRHFIRYMAQQCEQHP